MNRISTFKIQLNKSMYFLAAAALVLSLAGIVVSAYRITYFDITNFLDVLKYPFLILVSLLCIVIVIALLIKSQYIIDNKYLIIQYGLIKSKFALQSITSMIWDGTTNKLTVNFSEEFIVLTTDKDWNEEFVRAILAENSSVEYSFVYSEPKTDKKR